jgi:heavy metal sensor kinase
MKADKRLSISLRLTLAITLTFTFVLLVSGYYILRSLDLYLLREARDELTTTMELLLSQADELASDLRESMEEISVNPTMEISVFTRDGEILLTRNPLNRVPMLPNAGMSEITQTGPEAEGNHAGELENEHYHALVLRSEPLSPEGSFILQIAKDLGDEDHFISILREFLFLADLIGIGISFLIGFSISRKILRPIDEITAAAQRITATDLNERIPVTGPDDELSRLSRAFNAMLDRLQKSFTKQKRFVSDASHELRTPLSIISGYIGMLGRWAKSNPSLLEESIETIKAETSRMQTLIERLLFLARSDDRNLKMTCLFLDLHLLIEEVVQDMRLLAPERDFHVTGPGELLFHGDRDMLRRMLFIFLDNSMKYSAPRSPVYLDLSVDDTTVRISIRDFGPGIDPEKREAIFDRFYRIDDSRSKKNGGFGLGLSIAREIVELHSGSVSVDSSPGEGSTFTVSLPLGGDRRLATASR